ncbi:hypothetical protein LMG1864_03057 [Achromobacter ruhlandii]|nr:hypothetical protein LMG1864_03057 [Achromobacter ruhlandii]
MYEISEHEIVERLQFDNPWWKEGLDAPLPYSRMPRRKYFAPFLAAVRDRSVRRAVVLMGPRRVGKTVMIQQTIEELLRGDIKPHSILYLSLETPLYTGMALERILKLYMSLHGINRKDQVYVFFDEIQYLKDWEVHLKSLVDSYELFKFIATGSAAAALRMKSNESGAGRFSDFELPPLTFAEYLQFVGREEELIECTEGRNPEERYHYEARDVGGLNAEFINYLNYGGYPEAVFSETVQSNPGQFIKSDIIDKVLLRDLPSLYGISDIQELNRLFTVLAYNTGNEVSLEELSKSSGVAKNTIKRYLEYLEAAFLITRVERIDNNARRFKRAVCFKVYLTNPSMRAALFGHINPESEAMGALTETAIFSQWRHSQSADLFYARWNNGEIDIVSIDSTTQSPQWIVEVKWSDRALKDDKLLRHCVQFATNHRSVSQPVLVTTRNETGEKTVGEVDFTFVPSSLYAYILGANILRIRTRTPRVAPIPSATRDTKLKSAREKDSTKADDA